METSTGTIVEGQMSPMDAAPITQQLVVTGQYLYDNFVATGEAEVTKMDMVRDLATKADALQIKGACDKMVEKAKEVDKAAGVPDKVTKDGKEVANRGPKTQHAMNVRTMIQQAWGALKFAPEELKSLGYTDSTGYQDMRVLAKKALEAKRVTWTGQNALTQADRDRKAQQKATKGQMDALQAVQKENPFGSIMGESLSDWNTRTIALAQTAMEKARAEQTAKDVQGEFDRLTTRYDANTLMHLAEALYSHMGLSVELSVNQQEPSDTPVDPVVDEIPEEEHQTA